MDVMTGKPCPVGSWALPGRATRTACHPAALAACRGVRGRCRVRDGVENAGRGQEGIAEHVVEGGEGREVWVRREVPRCLVCGLF